LSPSVFVFQEKNGNFAAYMEVVSKPPIGPQFKARADRKSAAYTEYVSIFRRTATPKFGSRGDFETTSRQTARSCQAAAAIKRPPQLMGVGSWLIAQKRGSRFIDSRRFYSQPPNTRTFSSTAACLLSFSSAVKSNER
jgi:hypothetical protein